MIRILIVEDEPNMVAGLRDNFEYEGYEVITAPDGVAGLERALKEKPDLVILDADPTADIRNLHRVYKVMRRYDQTVDPPR